MSNHPYRQKALTLTSAPYPLEEFVDSSASTASFVSTKDVDVDESTISANNVSNSEFHASTNAAARQMSLPRAEAVIGGGKQHGGSSRSLPYQNQAALTPPPVFAQRGSNVVLPISNALSATSSVTNLNLSQSSNLGLNNQLHSKSESNLLASVTDLPKQDHKRSYSSSSSFFYDRADNGSMVDFSQNLIQQYLGDKSNHLLPRIKTIELYRKNAKKSQDPTVLFQYAQYMLQTALLLDTEEKTSQNQSVENSPYRAPLDKESNTLSSVSLSTDKEKEKAKKTHSKSKSSNSLDLENIETVDDARLKKALLKEAVFYLKKLADKGYVDAQYLLGDAYSSGALGKVENREAFVLFQAAAKHGHVESAYRTSYCYEEGLGTGRDARKALNYLKMAASKNHPAGMYKLGVYSFHGKMGLSSNIDTKKIGIKWLTRASNVANELTAAAPYELGKIYYNGFHDIVIADKKYALELYSQAAALGHIQSAAILGQFYEFGEIVPQDSNLSIHYYTQAALGGDPESMLAMCAWYLVGSDPYLPKDESEAFEWAKRAALCDLPKAQYALGNFYEKGIGCIKNDEESQTWYKKAAENGDEKSLSRVHDKEFVAVIQKKWKKRGLTLLKLRLSNSSDKDCVIV